jgi:hypothetical protein
MSPYIAQARREDYFPFLEFIKELRIDNSGEFNYIISQLAMIYVEQHGINYRIYNEIIGAIECAKQEIYVRLVSPLEKKKREENGDVFDIWPGETTPK